MKELISARYIPLIFNDDPLSVIGSIFWNWAEADRFGILNKYSPYNFIVNPMKEKFDFTITSELMEDIIDKVANELVQKANNSNKKLVVLWSGGVDSTAIVCALRKNSCTKDQLVILYTQGSIEEYPLMYDNLRKAGYRMIKFNWKNQQKAYSMFPNDYFVVGWCADQLFGSNINQSYPDEYNKPFKEGLRNILIKKYTSGDMISYNLDLFDDYAKSLGVELKYTCDALWWFNFAIKWSHVSMDLYMTFQNPEQRKNIINFFEDIRFQEWSYTHYQEFHKEHQANPKLYKLPLKRYIFNFNKDEDYFNNKGKLGSWARSGLHYVMYDTMCVVDTEGCRMVDLTKPTEWSKNLLHPMYTQDVNRMYHLLEYLKPSVDIERMKYAFTKGGSSEDILCL